MSLKTTNKNRKHEAKEHIVESNPLETHWVPQSKMAPKENEDVLKEWVPLKDLAHHETQEELEEFLKNK